LTSKQYEVRVAVFSMTGFARSEGACGETHWAWEVKSVNGRTLEVRCRLPQRMDWLEPIARDAATARLRRGHVGIALNFNRAETLLDLRVNEGLLEKLLAVAADAAADGRAAPPRIDGLLGLRGVVETVVPEEDETAREARDEALVSSLHDALDELSVARRAEGAQIEIALRNQLDEIETLTERAAAAPALAPEAIKARLAEKLAALLDENAGLPEEKIAQEAALLALKADVREELDRLRAHLVGARELLDDGEAVGRKLDFLCQEFNREANTLCSKSNDLALTRSGLDLKAVIDQFREQIQNVE
jgi:uncharacterized protein (TIGR00255 family)